MSKRRAIGDTVFVFRSAVLGESMGELAFIPNTLGNQEQERCMICDDPDCREWNDVWTLSHKPMYHVSECYMLDPNTGEKS